MFLTNLRGKTEKRKNFFLAQAMMGVDTVDRLVVVESLTLDRIQPATTASSWKFLEPIESYPCLCTRVRAENATVVSVSDFKLLLWCPFHCHFPSHSPRLCFPIFVDVRLLASWRGSNNQREISSRKRLLKTWIHADRKFRRKSKLKNNQTTYV